ncbi:conjugal transfer protein TrbF [Acidocella sp.]|uniref:conjugal transfer protein TrbF n=1 Tax=Acidocella sp. TaxID=50710 RepID=UPI003CFE9F2C
MRNPLTRRQPPALNESPADFDKLASSSDGASPYLAGRREWNERYGDFVKQASQWRLVAIGALAVAFVAVGWAGYRSSQSRFVPFVVQVNKLGDAVAVAPLTEAPPEDGRVIAAQLARWIFDVRSVFNDQRAETTILADAYTSIAPDSQAFASLNQWLQQNNPYKRSHDDAVSVNVHDVLPISPNVYRVTWTENDRGRHDGTDDIENWSAIITIKIEPPASASAIMKNPMGIYITNFSWSRSVN